MRTSSLRFRIIIGVISFLVFLVGIILFSYLDCINVKTIDSTSSSVCFISGIDATIGGSVLVLYGQIINGEFQSVGSNISFTEASFDYFTAISIGLAFVSLIAMVLFLNKKVHLFIFTLINSLSIVLIALQPIFFQLVNQGSQIASYFSEGSNYFVGSIVLASLLGVLDLTYYFRVIFLFTLPKDKI